MNPKYPFLKTFQAVAHRGAHQDYPENSLAAFREALALGATMIEFDVQLSADGVAMIFHDYLLRRMCGQAKALNAYSSEELSAMRLLHNGQKSDQKIPRLEDLWKSLGSKMNYYVELKTFLKGGSPASKKHLATEVVRLVDKYCLQEQVLIVSFDLEILNVVADLAPDLALGLNCLDWPQGNPQVDVLCPYYQRVLKEGFPRRFSARYGLLPWGVLSTKSYQALQKWPLHGVVTDRLAILQD